MIINCRDFGTFLCGGTSCLHSGGTFILLMELLGRALRPARSDETKMLSADEENKCTMDGGNKFPGLKWKNIDKELNFDKAPKMPDLKREIADHVLAYGEAVGVYERMH